MPLTRETNQKKSDKQLAVQRDSESLAALFPALLVEAQKLAQTITSGAHGRREAGQGEAFWQHRPYTFGDAVSDIDWRQSARAADKLYIRQNEWEAANAVWLWRDPSASMSYQSDVAFDEKSYRATVLALALSTLLSKGGERIGVLGSDKHIGASSRLFHGRGAPKKVLENLNHNFGRQISIIPNGENLRPGHQVVLISDFFMEPDAISQAIDFAVAKGAKGILCQILDPAEKTFPFKGRTEFLDVESDASLLFGSARSIRKDYNEAFSQHQRAIKTISEHAGWPLFTHYTDKPARDALLFLVNILSEDMRG